MRLNRRDVLRTRAFALIAPASLRDLPLRAESQQAGMTALRQSRGMKVGIRCGAGRFSEPVPGEFQRANFTMVTGTAIQGSESHVKEVAPRSYRDYPDGVLPAVSIRRLIFWSIFDSYGMLAQTQPRWWRPDGQRRHAGVTDEHYAPKRAYHAVRSVLSRQRFGRAATS